MFKKSLFFSIIIFFLAFSIEACNGSYNEDEEEGEGPFPYILKAVDSKGNSALFVGTDHEYPWKSLPEWFKEQILSRKVAVLETASDREAHERFKDNLESFTTDKLPDRALLDPKDAWTITSSRRNGRDSNLLYQKLYSEIANKLQKIGFDYSYLHNFHVVAPGFLANLHIDLFSNTSFIEIKKDQETMDSCIENTFKKQEKGVIPLRMTQNFENSSWAAAKYSNVKEDINLKDLIKFNVSLDFIDTHKDRLFSNIPEEERLGLLGVACKQLQNVEFETEGESESEESEDESEDESEEEAEPKDNDSNFQKELKDLEDDFIEGSQDPSLLNFANTIGKENKSWMPTILKQVATDEAVIVIGAHHLVGPDGILVLGRKVGITWQYYIHGKDEWKEFEYKPALYFSSKNLGGEGQ